MAFEFWMVGGITTFLMWLTANLGLKRRFAYFKSQNASIEEVLGDFEVRFFFLFREIHKHMLKLGLGASLYLIIDMVSGTTSLDRAVNNSMIPLLFYLFRVYTGL